MKEIAQASDMENHADKPTRRTIFAYRSATLVALAISLVWTAIFGWQGWWLLASSEAVLATVALASWFLIGAGRLTTALVLSEIAFFIFIVFFCMMFDIPSPQAPRVSHLYLPLLAMLAYINHLRRRSTFQLAFIGACLAAFVTFSATTFALPFAQPIPEEFRLAGIWTNSILSTLMTGGAIYMLQREFSDHKGMARALRAAIHTGAGLELVLQPQVDRTGATIGAEALLRWKHARRGQVPPDVFISLAEENGLMPALGARVLDEACRILAAWQADPAMAGLTLAVNVSASQFAVEGFERTVLDRLARHGADPARLKLELTESVLISGVERVVRKMEALRAHGIRFALDDFGTGYSSLSYLRRLPVQEIKIDRSFVQEAPDSDNAAALVKSIVQIGLDLGLVLLAEGVETREQYVFLLACGCTEFQGYHFGRPVPGAVFQQSMRVLANERANMSA